MFTGFFYLVTDNRLTRLVKKAKKTALLHQWFYLGFWYSIFKDSKNADLYFSKLKPSFSV